MQLPPSVLLLVSLFSAAHLAQGRPTAPRPRDINISHKSVVNGTATTHSIPTSSLPAKLAAAIEGSDININLTTDRVKRSPEPATGINNSTINLTVIGSEKAKRSPRERHSIKRAAKKATAAQHHNIHIDASSSGTGGIGGIHNSTVNINLNQTGSKKARKARRKVDLGDHSVLVDVSSSTSDDSAVGGIEDSTVHVNILPPRALSKSTGHHSIVVDSSSLDADADSSTTTGAHSAVVDTSSSTGAATGTTGVKNSTINLTVISPKDEDKAADAVESPVPSLARLSKRALPAHEAWASTIQHKDLASSEEVEAVAAAPAPVGPAEPSGFVQVRRDHSSKRSTIAKRA
ncbi:uncharacterized protein JCM10292_007014 [Rhodotorula paludigena]|uniref:uncharacterized protein n=1 Tax=Rhodotorula paludigena TaxID=86838 RepID=UPI00317D52F9